MPGLLRGSYGPDRARRCSLPAALLAVIDFCFAVFALFALFAFIAGTEGVARADLQVDGRWRQGPLREDFTVREWLPNGCGPAPQTNTSGGGEIVAIRLEGDELAFVGGGRVYRSNQCYDQMPTLARETHSRDASGKTWRTRCTTPANDPRKAILNTLVVATTDTHIDIIETGRYEVVVETGKCVADVKRTRTYDIVPDDKPAATASAPPPPAVTAEPTAKPEPKPAACESPGEPARLEVRPSKKLLRTGDSFQFRSSVLDAKNCATRTPTVWKLQAGAPPGITVDASGKVTIGAEVPEGAVELIASAAEKEVRVSVEVTQPAHYDDLLARSGLNASGENEAASVVTIASTSIGAGEGRVEDRSRARRWMFIGIVGAVLVVLAVLATVLGRRARRASALEREATERHEAEVLEVLERRRVREEQHAAQKRAHEESVAAAAAARARAKAVAPAAPAPPQGQPGAPPGAQGTIAMSATAPKRGKICPTCGDRFDGAADFCGKDGTQLVLLN
jgi:type IV secretory pathway VirB10-like protein